MMEKKDFAIKRLGPATVKSPLENVMFTDDRAEVAFDSDPRIIAEYLRKGQEPPAFEQAGPREMIFHDPAWCRAAILTAGGLCPGLNEVVKFLTLDLIQRYHVPVVYGIRYGYRGLDPKYALTPIELTADAVDDIHDKGGTILGSSRGAVDPAVMVDTLVRMRINLLFCIGGDGTARGVRDIAAEAARRNLPLSVIAIPKTIDNDIGFIDQSFGFATAVLHAGPYVTCAHNEAKGAPNCVGLIKVMGRDSGFIAAYTTLANPFVNYCLIPELPFTLEDGEHALLPHLAERIRKKQHAVIIVAEGAGQNLFDGGKARDASGNLLHHDIGTLLASEIKRYFKEHDLEINLKYFDPGYAIRSVPASGEDAVFCALLAQNAVHAAMSGRTNMMVGHWAGEFTHVPIELATRERKKIDLNSPLWTGVRSLVIF